MKVDIQSSIDLVLSALTDVIEALPAQIEGTEVFEPDTDSAIEAANTANNEVKDAVTDGFDDLVDIVDDAGAVALQAGFASTVGFWVSKTLRESAHRVQGAMIARQILDDERDEAIDKAVQTSIGVAEAVAESELFTSVALYDEVLAEDNGFSYYEYNTSEDGVVRPEHKSRNGKIFRYGSKRVADDVPGLAHRCRCVAFPLSDEEALQRIGDFYYSEDAPEGINNMSKTARISITFPGNKKHKASVSLEGMIGDWYEYNDFQSFKQRVYNDIGGDSSAELHLDITSHGGYADDALACYSWLRSLPNRVVSHIYGYAGSAATAFIAASDHVTADKADQVLIHKAWTMGVGNADDMRKTAEELDATDNSLVIAYQQKTGKSKEEIIQLMEKDRYINAQAALEFGLIDEIRGETPLTTTQTTGGYMPTQEEYDQLQGQFDTLKAEKETSDGKVNELTGQIDELNVQVSVLAKKAEQADNIDDLVNERIEQQAAARAEVTAHREKLEGMGFEAKGETVAELNRGAVLAMGLDGADKFTDEQSAMAITMHQKFNASSDSDGGFGRQLMGKQESSEKPLSRAARSAQMKKERENV